MITKDKIELVKKVTQVFVADDGTEFKNKYSCLEYERERMENALEHLRIKELEDTVPINCDDRRDDHQYTWYKVNNEEELEKLNNAYDGILDNVKSFPEIICIEKGYDGDVWYYYLSHMFEYTKWFWELLGYSVSFEKGEKCDGKN